MSENLRESAAQDRAHAPAAHDWNNLEYVRSVLSGRGTEINTAEVLRALERSLAEKLASEMSVAKVLFAIRRLKREPTTPEYPSVWLSALVTLLDMDRKHRSALRWAWAWRRVARGIKTYGTKLRTWRVYLGLDTPPTFAEFAKAADAMKELFEESEDAK